MAEGGLGSLTRESTTWIAWPNPWRLPVAIRRLCAGAACVGFTAAVFYVAFLRAQPIQGWAGLGWFAGLYGFLLATGSLNLMIYLFGFLLSRFPSEPGGESGAERIRSTPTAIVMPICHEEPEAVAERVRRTWRSVKDEGLDTTCDFYLLSDSTDPAIREHEERVCEQLQEEFEPDRSGAGRLFLLRRRDRDNYKAGNIARFLEQYGDQYELMLVLDADSLMSGKAIRRLIRRLEARPDLALVQSTVLPINSVTPFARSMQYAFSRCLPLYARGMLWLLGPDSVYWGHNALIRIRPFMEHCQLPAMPGRPPLGGTIMSQDIVEAALLGRAGWGIDWDLDSEGSYDELPANIVGYGQRDRRWCQGNFQHFWLIFGDGMTLGHRLYFANGILAYAAGPLLLILMAWGFLKTVVNPASGVDPVMFWSFMAFLSTMMLLPRMLGVLQTRTRRRARLLPEVASMLVEMVMAVMIAPLLFYLHAVFIWGILRGKRVLWQNQSRRAAEGVSWGLAARIFWVPTAIGIAWMALAGVALPTFPFYLAPILGCWALSIPIAVSTSSPRVGRWLARVGLFPQ